MKSSVSRLLEQAEVGGLSEAQCDELALFLSQEPYAPETYDVLHAIGHSMRTKYRPLVEAFLRPGPDPMIASMALGVLCQWGLCGELGEVVSSFIRGVDWDPDNDIRLTALLWAGEWLVSADDSVLLEAVLGVFDDMTLPENVRVVAYKSILRADGRDWEERPLNQCTLSLSSDTEGAVLERVRQRVRGSCGNR